MNQTTTMDLTGTDINLGQPHNTILFNDETHDQLEVAAQIIRAIHCTPQKALNIMMEAHTTGRAIVYTGHKERAEHVANVLEEIRLGTKVEPA
jgi:ATP-dependent Clp protease adapter protein ClpS